MVGDIARSFNIPYRYDVRMRILGTTEQMTAKLAVNELRLPISVDEFKVRFAELGRQRLGNAPLLQGLLCVYCQIPTITVEDDDEGL